VHLLLVNAPDPLRQLGCQHEVSVLADDPRDWGTAERATARRFEVFHIVADLPHGKYRTDRARKLLHWQPRDSLGIHWRCRV
jgi:hypothetical protein